MAKELTWSLKTVKVSDITPNPNNPKQRDEKGFERLKKSLSKFGSVFDGICNADLSLIDGHSRIELKEPTDNATVFVPSRKLTKKEETELNAIFDLAKAGDIDWNKLQVNFDEFGINTDDWGIEIKEQGDIIELDKITTTYNINIKCDTPQELDEMKLILNITSNSIDSKTLHKLLK